MIDEKRINALKDKNGLPQHVAIIMDGNGRWAKKRGLLRTDGHKEGIKSVRAVVEVACALHLKAVTLYTFSSENWARPKQEVSVLMSLLLNTLRSEINELNQKNIQLTTIGDINSLPMAPRMAIKNTINKLDKNSGLILNLALSYSSRQEIVTAVKKIGDDVREGKLSPKSIDEKVISRYLQTHFIGDPDLLIRTSGEMRISNFLLWQLAYTELYITDVLWPDFRHSDFLDALEDFQSRERRFGKVSEQLD